MKTMNKELKAPVQEHRCKVIENCESVSISKRLFDGKYRWMWEQTQKNGHIAANEITFCPYCGADLNRRAARENKADIGQLESLLDDIVLARLNPDDVIAQANKLKDALTDLRSTEPENKPLTLDELRQMDGKSVWCEIPQDNPQYGIVKTAHESVWLPVGVLQFKYYGEWKAYARRPEGSETGG